MKPVLAKWLLLWLRARKLPRMDDSEVIDFLMSGLYSRVEVLKKVQSSLGDDHVKMLNLGHDWLQSYLPFVLMKVNRVHYGLLYPADIAQLNAEGVKIPMSRKLTAGTMLLASTFLSFPSLPIYGNFSFQCLSSQRMFLAERQNSLNPT